MIYIGLLIIAVGAFCQSSSYVPINKVRDWSWESYWLIQGIAAWVVFPLIGAMLAVPAGHTLRELFASDMHATLMTMFYGMLWGIGGLTFGLSMRYLGVALGQSISLGTCAALGTILAPLFTGHAADLTSSVITGVVITLVGIGVIGTAGMMRQKDNADQAQKVKYNFGKGITVAVLAGFMSACFNIGLAQGADLHFEGVSPMLSSLPATLLVTLGGFITNLCYCLYQNKRNRTFGDYKKGSVWLNNLMFCILAGALWYSQFFGLSIGKGFLNDSPTLTTFAFCILMALNIVFSNVWGIILKEWKGSGRKTVITLISGLIILIISCFIPQLI